MADRRERGVAPATSKALEVGILSLYVGLIAVGLYAGAVPDYRSTAGDAVAERTLAAASQRVEQAVPPGGSSVSARARVTLPETIRGRRYEVRAVGRQLVLDHPHPRVRTRSDLALPPSVVDVSGSWSSDRPAVIAVRGTSRGLRVELERGAVP